MAFEFSHLMESASVILYHKQSTSAMTRFFKLDDGSVVLGNPLEKLGRVVTGEVEADSNVVSHPGAIMAELEDWLGLAPGDLAVEPDFLEWVEVPAKVKRIYLARFKTIDPPFVEAETVGASFVTLTQTRGMNPVELELLRSAYSIIMEG